MFPGVVLGTRTFVFRDFGLFSYPVAHFQRQCFWRGEWPLWNPYNLCGVPFLAQWNTMCLYPPALFYLLLPLTWALPMFCLLHLVWGGLGMFYLARQWTRNSLAGALAAIIFAFNGLTLNLLMWPSHIATFSWLPWVLWLVPNGWRKGGRKLGWGVAAAALQMLAGGPETILVTWGLLALLLVGDVLQCLLRSRDVPQTASARGNMSSELRTLVRSNAPSLSPPANRGRTSIWLLLRTKIRAPLNDGTLSRPRLAPTRIVLRFSGLALVVALLCSAQLLPFLQLLLNSQRDSGYSASTHDWSMPLWGYANFLVPLFRMIPTPQGVWMQPGQYWTSSYYAGVGTVLLAAIAVRRAKNWRVYALAGVLYLGLMLSAGDTNLLFCFLRWCCPALGWVRYPVKFVIVVEVAAPLLAAYGLASIRRSSPKGRRWEVAALLAILAVILLAGFASRSGPPDLWPSVWHNAMSRAAFLIVISALLVPVSVPAPLRSLTQITGPFRIHFGGGWRHLAAILLLFVFWLDLCTHVPNQNPTAPPEIYSAHNLAPSPVVSAQLAGCEGRLMVSPGTREAVEHSFLPDTVTNFARSRALELGDCNLLDNIRQVGGFFSLVPRESFRTTQLFQAQSTNVFAPLLDFMGVTRTISVSQTAPGTVRPTARPLVTAGQQPVFADDAAALSALAQTNVDLSRTVYLPVEAASKIRAGEQPNALVRSTKMGNLNLAFQTESPTPALVVISQTHYPAWRAYIDGKSTPLWRADYAFQALEVPAGAHHVEIKYQDWAFRTGVVLSFLGILLWLGLLRPGRRSTQ